MALTISSAELTYQVTPYFYDVIGLKKHQQQDK
jgi:hypothetical protein